MVAAPEGDLVRHLVLDHWAPPEHAQPARRSGGHQLGVTCGDDVEQCGIGRQQRCIEGHRVFGVQPHRRGVHGQAGVGQGFAALADNEAGKLPLQ